MNNEPVRKTCFYHCVSYNGKECNHESERPEKNALKLYGCISNSLWPNLYTHKERLNELRTSREQNAQMEQVLFGLDLFVAFAPGMNTGEQLMKIYDDPDSLTFETGLKCAFSAAGDVFWAGKAVKPFVGAVNWARGVANGAKASAATTTTQKVVTVAAFLSGVASTTNSGYSLYHTSREDWNKGDTWGKAGMFALSVLGLYLDKDAHTLMKPYIKRQVAKVPLPAAANACRRVCRATAAKVQMPLFKNNQISNLGTIVSSRLLRRLPYNVFPRLAQTVRSKVWIDGDYLRKIFNAVPPSVRRKFNIAKDELVARALNFDIRALRGKISKKLSNRIKWNGIFEKHPGMFRYPDPANTNYTPQNEPDWDTSSYWEVKAWGEETPDNSQNESDRAAQNTIRKIKLIDGEDSTLLKEHAKLVGLNWFADLEAQPDFKCVSADQGLDSAVNDWMALCYHDNETQGDYCFAYNHVNGSVILDYED